MKILAFPAFSNRKSNPYNYLLNRALVDAGVDVGELSFKKALAGQYDLLHIHWPEWYLNNPSPLKALINSSLLLVSIACARFRGKKVVWTVHNLRPHAIKHPIMSKFFWLFYKKMVSATLSLSEANKRLFLNENEEFKNRLNEVTFHGLYTEAYKNNVTRDEAVKKLGLEPNVKACLFIGQLKPYKNIEKLISLFSSENSLKDKILIIAGKFDSPEYREAIVSQIGSKPNIKLFEGFVDDDDLQYFFSVAELSILPFKNIFNSGSALLSASFNVPVLVPENENFKEYGSLLPGLIHTYIGFLNADIILNAFKANNEFKSEKVNSLLDWSSVAEATKLAYKAALNGIRKL